MICTFYFTVLSLLSVFTALTAAFLMGVGAWRDHFALHSPLSSPRPSPSSFCKRSVCFAVICLLLLDFSYKRSYAPLKCVAGLVHLRIITRFIYFPTRDAAVSFFTAE